MAPGSVVDRPRLRRLVGGLIGGGASGLFGIAAWLSPAVAGLGTHEQLGLRPCNWVSNFQLPCPTCGMTTAYSHAVRGNLIASFLAQPFGCILAIATAAALLVGLYVLATGSRIHQMLLRLWTTRTVWIMVTLLLAAWAYKILEFKGII